MSSFLKKLRRKGVVDELDELEDEEQDEILDSSDREEGEINANQLPVDVFQTDDEIVIYANIAGSELKDLDVSIEGDGDVITIEGRSRRPVELSGLTEDVGDYSLEECQWGEFYRQIILPEEVNSSEAEAKAKDGILVLRMPLKGKEDRRFKMDVVRVENRM